jgi:hypothetical protein
MHHAQKRQSWPLLQSLLPDHGQFCRRIGLWGDLQLDVSGERFHLERVLRQIVHVHLVNAGEFVEFLEDLIALSSSPC